MLLKSKTVVDAGVSHLIKLLNWEARDMWNDFHLFYEIFDAGIVVCPVISVVSSKGSDQDPNIEITQKQ